VHGGAAVDGAAVDGAAVDGALDDPSKWFFSVVSGDAYNEIPTFPVRPSYAEYQT
jgi:hypothetical protein